MTQLWSPMFLGGSYGIFSLFFSIFGYPNCCVLYRFCMFMFVNVGFSSNFPHIVGGHAIISGVVGALSFVLDFALG